MNLMESFVRAACLLSQVTHVAIPKQVLSFNKLQMVEKMLKAGKVAFLTDIWLAGCIT